ncbi:AAA family ATPase [Kineococcus sp. NPDC059986]|uniref:AAA family ATPase n=1 Tax=Kineococcus sp. NPDC059986 TaxID=3155538 RepID=UPI00344E979C
MRIHRLVLDDFRGVEHRELVLPEQGVVVLEGANEVGKSSTLEALDMLLTEKHSSRKASVLAVKPVHRDAPSAVEAEISTGPYRFTLRKQWHSRPATTLTVHAPRREQLTGDEAHQRVRDILTETLDQALWDALRVLQDATPGATTGRARDDAALSGSSALAAALDAAAGSAQDGADGAQSLYAATADRAAQFWTATGRPTGRHRACAEELALARTEAARAREALDLLADDADRHAEVTADRAEVVQELSARTAEATDLAALVADLAARRDRLVAARERAAAADRAAAGARDALATRRREVADLARRTAALDQDTARAADLGPATEEARTLAAAAAASAQERAAALDAAGEAADTAAQAVRRAVDRAALRSVRRRLAAVTAAADEVRAAQAALTGRSVDATTVRALEAADDAVHRLRARADAVAARVVVEATAVEVLLDGRPVAAGTVTELAATRPLAVDVAGFATVRVLPGADTGPVADELDAAAARLQELLTAAGVEDVAAARAAHEERRAAQAAVDVARAQLAQLTADADADALRAEADRLDAELGPAPDDGQDQHALRQAEAAARNAVQEQRTRVREAQAEATALARTADRLAHELTALRTRLELSRAEVLGAADRLSAARAAADDAALEDAVARTATEATAAAEEVRALEADLAARDEDTVLRRAREVQTALDALATRRDALDGELVHLQARLSVMGGEERQEVWDQAASRVARLEEEQAGLDRRAAAARLLLQTLDRHRDSQRRRYVQPFTDRLEELGRTVFGETFGITLDDDLRIVQRTLHGRTVGYDQLSTGAREQLAVLLRLACATLVDPADGVPVVLDDALGHTDPDRLRRLAAVFEHVAPTTQVLLLAPGPGLHTGIPGATVLRLTQDPDPESVRTPAAAGASTG